MGWKERYFVFVPPTYWLRSWKKLLKKRDASNMCHKPNSSGFVERSTGIQISWNRGQSMRLSLHGPFTSSRIVPKLEQYKHDARKWPSKLTACHTDALSAKKSLFRWQRMDQVISHPEIIARVWTREFFFSKLLLFFILARWQCLFVFNSNLSKIYKSFTYKLTSYSVSMSGKPFYGTKVNVSVV